MWMLPPGPLPRKQGHQVSQQKPSFPPSADFNPGATTTNLPSPPTRVTCPNHLVNDIVSNCHMHLSCGLRKGWWDSLNNTNAQQPSLPSLPSDAPKPCAHLRARPQSRQLPLRRWLRTRPSDAPSTAPSNAPTVPWDPPSIASHRRSDKIYATTSTAVAANTAKGTRRPHKVSTLHEHGNLPDSTPESRRTLATPGSGQRNT